METGGSLTYSQGPANFPYLQPENSIPSLSILILKICFTTSLPSPPRWTSYVSIYLIMPIFLWNDNELKVEDI
jgi:hypothetical protein